MSSGKFDFANRGGNRRACEQGATFDHTITWRDADGNVINLSTYTAKLQVRSSATASTTAAELTTANGMLVVSSTNLRIIMTAAQTTALVPGTYVYDLILTSAGGVVTRLLEGVFEITAAVSR